MAVNKRETHIHNELVSIFLLQRTILIAKIIKIMIKINNTPLNENEILRIDKIAFVLKISCSLEITQNK